MDVSCLLSVMRFMSGGWAHRQETNEEYVNEMNERLGGSFYQFL